jgi:hypothetical protein
VKEPSSIYSSHISYGQRWRVVAADDTYDWEGRSNARVDC